MKLELANIKGTLLRLSKKRSVKQGLPFVLFIIGASFGLGQFTNLRYEYRKTKQTQEKMQDVGLPMRKAEEITLEAQYDIVKEYDTDHWENKRISRPWEEETPKS
ncbi:cytochrome c oxidase assembly protein COX16 homolog, mitochondrial [Fopius arisanus]|uniref:Cytochrome c oxidase assembly protein COX16 homolog, mitochondrial n=1 Tax=Fopius arisanus TaxID=64838 RepID=A0A9R1T0M9_9HYME|nr:PREDICTED: cytochrome c oxidase assembly protein COX16 homolog, mitochondrial [Fopius arisanus]XP_011300562.1 PREDICTED: cytochrome c oxidase assembly protein COX16 homolog, mitochondrial [Fopius arisanus]XP_011300563.1 PREDICTED: cytochrome c oxidase assembly protein COX16 homolog, mitochondrial [Fopius arisanus]XP_011300564.1 PREDICTED: cytochrome c oxidase assembly protein COX16 homolog, mitochondrial [Fopius arisanus]